MKSTYVLLALLLGIAVTGCEAQPRAAKAGAAAPWSTSGKVLYSNEYNPTAGEKALPYILGGTCVAPPSAAALARYQAAGYLKSMTLSQLEALYTAEKIVWTPQQVAGGVPGSHVLEGGKSLLTPVPGTIGYARLFCQPAPAYKATSPEVIATASKVEALKQPAQPVVAAVVAAIARPAAITPTKVAPLTAPQVTRPAQTATAAPAGVSSVSAAMPATRPAVASVAPTATVIASPTRGPTVAAPTTKPVSGSPFGGVGGVAFPESK